MKTLIKNSKDLISIIGFCLKMSLNPISKQFRKYFYLNIIFAIFMVILPFILIYVSSEIIQLLTISFLSAEISNRAIHNFLVLCGTVLLIGFISKAIEQFKNYCDGMHNEVISNHIRVLIMKKTAGLDVSYFDSPSFYNEMQDASRNAPLIAYAAFQTFDFLKFSVQLIVATMAMSRFSGIFTLVLAASIIPHVIFQRKQFDAMYAWQRNVVNEERKLNYLSDILLSRIYVKEVKLFNLFPFISAKFSNAWDTLFLSKRKLSFKYTTLVAASTFLPEISVFVFMVTLGMGVISREYTVGDYSYYLGIAGQILSCMYLVVFNYGKLMDGKSRIENYLKFMNWKSNIKDSGTIEFSSKEATIEFKNVSFRYEKDRPLVLKNASFTMKTFEKTAIVGVNGSGKSSIVRLMTRFYDPEEGRILLNGIDLREYTLESVRRCFSILFQDYPSYAFNIRESVSLSDCMKNIDNELVHEALEKSDAQSLVSKFPNGLDTYLTRLYDESGVELSGGEWQKISAARTFYRDAPIIILDEPSAALDAESEDKLFRQLEAKYTDRCTLLISHRLSNVISADHILVLDKGRIIERGKHVELMSANGTYARLFNLQANKYKGSQ